jgi:hypothetical protein
MDERDGRASMLRRLRENGPVVLVPAIWTVVTGTGAGPAGLALAGAGQTVGIVAAVAGY